jgi:peptidoglycan/LPS O-acetylase OafA/YrhL
MIYGALASFRGIIYMCKNICDAAQSWGVTVSFYRKDVDGLRAIAVLAVLFHHLGIAGFSGGYVGVDVFFVISGYLITALLRKDMETGRYSIADFYMRRIRRILPALTAVLLATTIIALWLLTPNDLVQYGRSLASAALFGSNFLFWSQAGYFDSPSAEKPLLHTWSLAVEEQFYLLWPLLLPFLLGRAEARRNVAALAAVSLLASEWAARTHPDAAFYLIPFRFWELLAGALLTWVPAPSGEKLGKAMGWGGLFLILLSVSEFEADTTFPGFSAVMPVAGAALIIGSGRVSILEARPLVGIGLISYSLYLWHWPILAFIRYNLLGPPGGALQILVVLLSFFLAYLSWRYIEQPFRKARPARGGILLAGAIAAAVTAIVGFLLILQSGFPTRWPIDTALAESVIRDRPANPDCHNHTAPPAASEVPACRLGNGPLRMALWGDSFSDALSPAFDDAPYSVLGMTKGLCPPLLGVIPEGKEDCIAFNEASFREILAHDEIRVVVLYSNWPLFVKERGRYHLIELSDSSTPLENSERRRAADVFRGALDRTVSRLHDAGKQVIVIAPSPAFDYWPTNCVIRQRVVGCAADRRKIETGSSAYAVFRSETVPVFWPNDHLCTATECPPVKGDQFLYSDGNHISRASAHLLSGPLLEMIAELLPDRGDIAGTGQIMP